ncbi:MAG: hypothetical protein IPJ77_18665 [Planctomycetes bacterium]|nr:hypothetical protein [Planctomycetota bacterium]
MSFSISDETVRARSSRTPHSRFCWSSAVLAPASSWSRPAHFAPRSFACCTKGSISPIFERRSLISLSERWA